MHELDWSRWNHCSRHQSGTVPTGSVFQELSPQPYPSLKVCRNKMEILFQEELAKPKPQTATYMNRNRTVLTWDTQNRSRKLQTKMVLTVLWCTWSATALTCQIFNPTSQRWSRLERCWTHFSEFTLVRTSQKACLQLFAA